VKILFDQGTPEPLRKQLPPHTIATAYELGWGRLRNGDLLTAAEADGFEIFITPDTNLKYQQNLRARKIAVVVLLSTSWPKIRQRVPAIAAAVQAVGAGGYVEVAV